MSNQLYHLYPSDLTNRQWENIKDLIPCAKPGGRPRSLDMRLVLNAMLYVLLGGIQWRMLPREYPNWKSVYYFRAWRKDGTWQRIHDTLRARVRRKAGKHKHPTAGCLDSQSVKSTHIKGERGFDNGKKVKGRKRHLLVDTLGLMMAVLVTTASVSDPAGARLLLLWLCGACKKMRLIWVGCPLGGAPIAAPCWSGWKSVSSFVCSRYCEAMTRKSLFSCLTVG